MDEGDTLTEAPIKEEQTAEEPTTEQATSNIQEPTDQEQLAKIQQRYAKLDKPTTEQRRTIIAELKALTARTKAPERPGALHLEPEPSSE